MKKHTPEEIIAHNVISVLDQANIKLEALNKYYLYLDISKSLSWSSEKNQYESDWSCCKNLINLPCDQFFVIKEKKINFENIVKKSINFVIQKHSQTPSL